MAISKYELEIRVIGENGETVTATISDPFATNGKKDRQQEKMEKMARTGMKSVAVRSSIAIVRGYTATLGNANLNDQIQLIESGVGFATQTAIATSAFGAVGMLMSLVSLLPTAISKTISFENGKTWDRLSTNKSIRRAGVGFNRSRYQ